MAKSKKLNFIQKVDLFAYQNMGTMARFGSIVYFLIEGVGIAIQHYYKVDDQGILTITPGFEQVAFWVEMFKVAYITWVEMLFGAVFYITFKKQRADGWQWHDVGPILISFALVALTTSCIFFMALVNMDFFDLISPFNGKEIEGRQLTMLILIPLSLVVNFLIVFIDDKNDTTIFDALNEQEEEDEKPKKPKGSEGGGDKPAKEENPSKDKEEKPEEPKEEQLLKSKWIEDPSPETLMSLIQRLMALKPGKVDYDKDALHKLDKEECEKIFAFIGEGKTKEDQIKRAMVTLESKTIIKGSENVRSNPSLAADWGKFVVR